jgi:signal transduction histidine kinase
VSLRAIEFPFIPKTSKAGGKGLFRSFRAKLMMLVAVAVSVPAVLTCLFLGNRLYEQARELFANNLSANLETFSLILQDNERNLFDGLIRTAADNTLQITLDLEIKAQLTKYIEAQRQVLGISFLSVFDRNSQIVALSRSENYSNSPVWRLGAASEHGSVDCVGERDTGQQLVTCNGTVYFVSAVPIIKVLDPSLGDASVRAQPTQLLGYLMGGTPVASAALIEALQRRHITYPLIWVGDKLVYSNIASRIIPQPTSLDGTAYEYHSKTIPQPTSFDGATFEYKIDQSAYLGAAMTSQIGTRSLVYGVMAPLAPLQNALLQSVMTVAGIALLLVVGTLIGLSFIVNRLLRPIQQLREGAAQIGSGDLSQRISIHTGDELETLADQFNDMAGRLQESYSDLENKVESRTSELAQSIKELRALGDVSQAVNSTLDLETVLSTIVAKAVQLSGTEAGAIYVFHAASNQFRLRATYGMSETMIAAITDQYIHIGETILGQTVAQRNPIQISDLRDEPSSPVQDIILRAGYRALLAVPLLRPDQVVGALVVRRKAPGLFPKSIVDALQTFAIQSVLAIQNARLFKEIEEKGHQLEIASKHKSQFLANMSHELRTPLNAILGYTELILDNIYGDTSEKMRGVLDRIQSNGRHLLGLINDVLDLSKIEAGQLTLSLTDYSLKDIVHGVFAAVEPLAAEKHLELKIEIPPNLPIGHGDERRLTQVLLNLVGNAIKFTDHGEVAIKASTTNGSFTVAVSDTGQGIAVGNQSKIFGEFQQADDSATKTEGGTGLGLTIAQRIIEMHGGRIWVESDLGQGSTFLFTVPISVEREVRKP